MSAAKADHDETATAFRDAVNMAPAELEHWLESDDSRAVGWPPDHGSSESVGHHSGRRIVEIKRKAKADLTNDDYAHMRKVVGYVHRHLAQRPNGDVKETRWRYSLMNWGHDPLKD
ncbi:DUF3140 domain-containing protein [Mangrovicella endophytica]|uniref:DUF3140 domain-containing protein n=1 Tax=Mangrovicella endophytica TaxID=2066697 RepID=UPI000C9E942D|nr:DUF3140 domain-containing protein [Mangrovicella endophytica]